MADSGMKVSPVAGLVAAGGLLVPVVAGCWVFLQSELGTVTKAVDQDRADRIAYETALAAEIKDVGASYVSLREHDEFKVRTEKDLERIDAAIINLTSIVPTIRELNVRVEALNARVDAADARLTIAEGALARGAHEPVEKATLDAINGAFDKRLVQLEGEIVDVNRQIAAALLSIEGNTSVRSRVVAPP